MNWSKFDPNNLPGQEVLAKDNRNNVLVGWLRSENGGECGDGNTCIQGVTHYIPIADLLGLKDDD